MLQKFACAVALVFVGSIALADTLRGVITAADDKEVTIVTGKKDERKTHKIAVTKDTKYYRAGKKKEKADSSLKALQEAIEKSPKSRGVVGTVEVEGKKATEVTFRTARRKKKTAD